jgi:uroporphyrinogen decarboxylase
MKTHFANLVVQNPIRQFIPIGVYAGLELTGATVAQAVCNPSIQAEAALALQEELGLQALLTGMDLSVEAEAFGCEVRFSDHEIPTILGRKVQTDQEIIDLQIPDVGDARMRVYLDTAAKLVDAARSKGIPVLGGVIGPFSLAGRIFGVSEALELTISDPDTLNRLLEKTTAFLGAYLRAFRDVGVGGVIMAEPAAGLLSPRSLGVFSSQYIRRLVEESQSEAFVVILHNCGAKLVHLPKVLEAGAEVFHFGAPMDLPAALNTIPDDVILAGNLDPTSVFFAGSPETVRESASSLLKEIGNRRNFILSSGCDLPPGTPLENIRAAAQVIL